MFAFNPDMAIGDSMDDGEEVFDSYLRDEDEEDGSVNVSYESLIFHQKHQSTFYVYYISLNI